MEAPRRPSGLGLDTLGSVTSKSLGRSNDLGVGAEVVEVLRVLMPEIGAELVARRTEVLGLHDAPQKAVLLGSVRALRASEVSKSYAKLVEEKSGRPPRESTSSICVTRRRDLGD